MKKLGLFAIVGLLAVVGIPYLVLGQSGGFASVWIPSGGNVQLFDSTYGVRIQSLSSPGGPCLSVSPTGVISTTTCGTGGAGAIYLATTSPWTTGNLARVASNGAVDSVATSSLGLSPAFTTSAALAALLSDETGTGNVVFSTNSTLRGGVTFERLRLPTGFLEITSTTEMTTTLVSTETTFLTADAVGQDRNFWLGIRNDGNFETGIYATSSNSVSTNRLLSFRVNNSERMRIDSAGNVGIASTTPGYALSVAGNSGQTGQLNLLGSAANIALGSNWLSGDGGDEGIFVGSTGGVGIATTTTSQALTVQGTSNVFQVGNSGSGVFPVGGTTITGSGGVYIQPGSTASEPALGIRGFTGGTAGIFTSSGGNRIFTIGNDGAGGATLAISGGTGQNYLGVGTTSPSANLTVVGNMRLTGAFADSASSTGSSGMVLTSTGVGTSWVATSSLGISGGSGTVYLATTSPWTTGDLAFANGNGAVGSVATGTLTEGVTGLELTATRGLVGGAAALNLTTGFVIPTSSLWTSVSDFFQTPSTRITAGTGLSWSGNTLNSAGWLSTTSPWTIGNAAFVASNGAVGSVATGTLTDNITGLSFNSQIRGLFGGAAQLSLDTGYTIPTSDSLLTANSSTTGNLAFWSGNQTIGNVATGTLTEGVTGLEFSATRSLVGGAAILNLTTGFVIPTSSLWTSVADFFTAPATRISLGAGLGWSSNTINSSTTPAFNLASTTLDANGRQFSNATATFLLRNVPNATTLVSWYCKASSTGSVMIRFGDGTNWTNAASCSTTGARITASTNNTFTADEDFMVQVGSSASSPSRVTITTSINNF